MAQERHYNVDYRLELEDGSIVSYQVEIDRRTLVSNVATKESLPAWTKLENEKCKDCKLEGSEYCPIAARLVEPIQRFKSLVSHQPSNTTVVTPERSYSKRGDVQDGIRSLFGLIMATSGCPAMQPFKFMARYHLPFSSVEETISRITSTYLLQQMFRAEGDAVIPFDLKQIEELYNTVQKLNESMVRRLQGAVSNEGDGALNAIVILSAYSSLIPIIFKDELKRLKPLFD